MNDLKYCFEKSLIPSVLSKISKNGLAVVDADGCEPFIVPQEICMNVIDIVPQLGKLKDMTFIGWWFLFIACSLIQVAPININPWSAILKWLGGQMTGDLRKDLNSLITDVRRQTILTFARECRQGVEHSTEEWNHVLQVAEEYEAFCLSNNIKNGKIKQDTKFIRDLYQEISREHRIK